MALAVWSALQDFPGTVTTVVKRALSAASVIAMGGSKRLIETNGRLAVHPPYVVIEKGGQRTAKEVAALSRDLTASTNAVAGIYATATGGDPDYWLSEMKREASYNAQEALQRGLVHGVIPAGQSGRVRDTAHWVMTEAADELPPEVAQEVMIQSVVAGAVGAWIVLAKKAQEQRQAARNGRPVWTRSDGSTF